MINLVRIARVSYGVGVAGIGVQQFIYGEFRPVILPLLWHAPSPVQSTWAYIAGSVFILAGLFIIISNRSKAVAVGLGILFFLLFACFHLDDQLMLLTKGGGKFELGTWINPLKELALSGGAFIVAVSFSRNLPSSADRVWLTIGRIFFSVMLIVFGISHFKYTAFVVTLVPSWIPAHLFWTYFGAVALIGSGVCILFKIMTRLISLLLGIMLFLWVILLHIPRAIDYPNMDKGNELTSVFEALAFSGVAFAITCIYRRRTKPGK